MKLRFAFAMARREGRSTLRRLLLYVSSVAVGVAALVAIESLRSSLDLALAEQSRSLLGADLELSSRTSFGEPLAPLIAELEQLGGDEAAYVTRFTSMARAEPSGRARLVWVNAVAGPYPHYGEVLTEPAGSWAQLAGEPVALVDPAALLQLGAALGDELVIGDVRFRIGGSVSRAPGRMGMRDAIAPRVFIAARYLDETRLLAAGSMARYSAYFRGGADEGALSALLERREGLLREQRVRAEGAAAFAQDLSEDLGRLSRFLGLVGLCALLLGGVGVASGVHAFVTDKLDGAAVLRCLGARSRDVFAVYLLQAGALGLLGSALGALLGVGAQALLPALLRGFLPFELSVRSDPMALLVGLGLGLWVTLLFASLPLLELRGVTPLRALRRDFDAEPGSRRDPWRLAALAAMGATLLAVSLWQAPNQRIGLWFAGGLLASLGFLAGAAWLLTRAVRRWFPRSAPYWLRQGVANLFRPRNQTLAVTLALGLGVFLIASLHTVQHSLRFQLDAGRGPERPNVAVFDIQSDQRERVAAVLGERRAQIVEQTPIVPARIAAAGGAAAPRDEPDERAEGGEDQGAQRGEGERWGRRRWALRREYRLTYRAEQRDTEVVTAGRWWNAGEVRPAGALPRVSLEEDLAADLAVGVGDRVTWDVQGVRIETEVANLRSVDWARFQTNFFAVLEPGALEQAPQSFVVVARLDDPQARAELQGALAAEFPNLSVLDAALMLEALDALLARVALAIRFMAAFAIGAGLLILIGTLRTSRYQRARECVLLRTLGAQSSTIRRILAAEYFALGAVAGCAGALLAMLATGGLMQLLFSANADLPLGALAVVCTVTACASAAIGLGCAREALRSTPLAGLRGSAEAR